MTTSLLIGSFSKGKQEIGNLSGCALALEIDALKKESAGPLVIIGEDNAEVAKLHSELKYLNINEQFLIFRDYETLPYDQLSAHQDIISSRLEFLSLAPDFTNGIILTSLHALMQRLSPVEFISAHSFVLRKGDSKDIVSLRENLIKYGYLQVEQVLAHGEFAVRGSILDIYPMGCKQALRIDFFDNEIDSLCYFDVQTQRSFQELESIKLLPAQEFPLNEESISLFRSRYREHFCNAHLSQHTIYQAISKGALPSGIEYYLPLFFTHTATFFDYLPKNSNLVLLGNFDEAVLNYYQEILSRASLFIANSDHPPLEAKEVFLEPKELQELIGQYPRIYLKSNSIEDKQSLSPIQAQDKKSEQALASLQHVLDEKVITLVNEQRTLVDKLLKTQESISFDAPYTKVPHIAFDHHEENNAVHLIAFIQDFILKQKGRVLITAVSEGRRQSLRDLLPNELINDQNIGLKASSSMSHFLSSSEPLMLGISPFDQGVIYQQKIAILTETELLGFKLVRQRKRNSHKLSLDQDTIIRNLAQLTEGQYVVHLDHGIGIYRGLKTEVINNVTGEYLVIEYQNQDKLSIPITALNKVARYSGDENPSLSKLGNDNWQKKKLKAAQKVRDVAAELLDIYAQRQLKSGFAFTVDERALEEFVASFPYEETEDQLKAIEQTLLDMQKPIAMDRLICGDVGFGKTEVALRAAFVAAMNGKQVALLAPTTILAEQHYQNFKERFAITPVHIDMLSRFRSPKEQSKTLEDIASGKVDIIIGTHRLLSSKLKFKDLGLLIIDEEHRFGVRQKEKLKAIRAEVDLLTLTATPIPRTLNMAMEGMRELSIIATPPEHRLAVKTFIHENSDQICREAILRELRRGGQVYYLHNDVATMELKANELTKLVPEAKLEIAHGQMNEQELRRVMQDFYHQRFNVLLCSTIVENGLDIASANTIIIDRADLLGLAQLHQIRGRVGRSHHQAYAYFFTPPKRAISADAKRRLEAIASIDELGAGFVLASHDLEIRGAGELLGEEQSGQISAVGFSLYMEMLSTAVKALQEGRSLSLHELTLNECEIDMHTAALLPDEYINNVNTRLSFYKRLSSCQDASDFEDLKIELIDRFGSLPQASENLFMITKLKMLASALGIIKIRGDENGASIEFNNDTLVDPHYILQLVQKSKHGEYKIIRPTVIRYNLPESDKNPRLIILSKVLKALASHTTKSNNELKKAYALI